MNYRIARAADGAIELTKIEEGVFRTPTRLTEGQRDKDTGWAFEELEDLGEQESIRLKPKVKIVIVSKDPSTIEVRPGPTGIAASTEFVSKKGQGGEGRHNYSGLTFSELEQLEVGQEYWVEK